MKMIRTLPTTQHFKLWGSVLIIAAATIAGMICAWRLPSLNLVSQDFLMRTRGDLPEPNDIIIVAIDEPSIAQLGQFPWKRSLTAQVLDKISTAQPKVISLDILYSEPSNFSDDKALADSIKRAGNVVVSEQLIEDRDTAELTRSIWLHSLTEIEKSAAGIGHVNVETEQDGSARQMLMRLADDNGDVRWALGVETVRVGDNLKADEIAETKNFVRIGSRKIPFPSNERNLKIKLKDAQSRVVTSQPLRMTIDYIGSTGSFSSRTVSFADVLQGKIDPERFRGKYVLIGATAATLGDRIATPFVHTENADGDQHGDLMPGVEILANSINTILRERYYQPVSDWTAALFAALVALAVLFFSGFAQGRFETIKQLGVFSAILIFILFGSYFVFVQGFTIPPVVPMFASFIVAIPLTLLRRSIVASSNLDRRIEELIVAEKSLLINGTTNNFLSNQRLTEESENAQNFGKLLPHGLEWKTETLGFLSRDLIAHSLFVDRAMRSLEEGLLIADAGGRITFVNQSAAKIFDLSERKLIGSDIFAQLTKAENGMKIFADIEKILAGLFDDQKTFEREIVFGNTKPRYYILRLSAVTTNENAQDETLGIVATLSDVSQHRELQQTKNDVISLVTHELRTPLTAIQGMSELLTEHEIEPESQAKMLNTINSEAKRLARMVNEYLDITRLESGVQKVHFAPTNVETIIEQTLLLLEPLAALRGIKIIRHFEVVEPTINADAELLSRAVTNIVANAIKYSPDKTSITIETKNTDEALKIIVQDKGCGISADQLPHIFEKFYRVPRRQTSEIVGTGLGLSLTQEIIELHGGSISAKSELNNGATFTIILPFSE